MARTIIIGAGINGLLLGALFAHDGDEVTVIEKNSFPGGRAFMLERDGYVMDYGVHLTRFGPVSALAKIMKRIGNEVSFRKLGTSYVINQRGEMVIFPTSPGGVFKSRLFTVAEKIRIIGLLIKIKKGAFDEGLMDVSLRDWLNRNNITGGIRTYFELLSGTVMVCPFFEKTSAGEMFRILRKILVTGHSAEYMAGGWKPVYAALISEIEKKGKIHYGSAADSIIFQKGKAVGVSAGRKKFMANRVVINLPAQEIFSIMPEKSFDPAYVKLCKSLVPTSGIFFDIALSRHIGDYDGLLITTNPLAYGMLTSNLASGLVPEGGQILTMFYPTMMDDVRDTALRLQRKEELWEAIRQYFHKIDQHILWTRESSLKMVDGVQVNTTQTADRRPGPVVPGVKNLYLVGDSITAPGAGGDIGNESVLVTYQSITGSSF